MIDGEPPYMDEPPVKALFSIVSKVQRQIEERLVFHYFLIRIIYTTIQGRPPFKSPGEMSDNFKDFVNKCTILDPAARPTATELLRHPFLKIAGAKSTLIPMIVETKKQLQPVSM